MVALLCAGWAAGSAMDVRKYGGRWAPLLLITGMMAVVGLVSWVRWSLLPGQGRQPDWPWFVGLWLLLVLAQAAIYPMAQRRPASDRNDSEDALNLASGAMLHGHFPYYASTFLGAPITPMPGAVMLALPFRLIHRVRWQNLLWEAALIFFARRYFRTAAAGFAFLLLVFADSHTFLNLAVGADYPANFIYVAMAVWWWLGEVQDGLWRWGSVLFLGVALSSRLSYLLVFPGLMFWFCQQRLGVARALFRVLEALGVTAIVTLPFYLYDPTHFSPLHVTDRLSFLAPGLARMVLVGLMVAALGVVASGSRVRLTVPRVFLFAGVACAVLIGVPGLLACRMRGFDLPSLTLLGYVDAATFFFSLWAFRAFEDWPLGTGRNAQLLRATR